MACITNCRTQLHIAMYSYNILRHSVYVSVIKLGGILHGRLSFRPSPLQKRKSICCYYYYYYYYHYYWGTRLRSWLRHCATSRKVAGSISDDLTGIFHCHNPSGCTMALGSTHPLTEISTRNISWGVKAAGA
jgi:hypothetical protein